MSEWVSEWVGGGWEREKGKNKNCVCVCLSEWASEPNMQREIDIDKESYNLRTKDETGKRK